MIVSCPVCPARFRLDRQRLGGKRITLRCPRCRQVFKSEVPASTGPAEAMAPPARLRVLVAHGDAVLRATVGEILGREGIEAVLCADGQEALSRLAGEPLPMAIVDVALPGLFAFELIEQLRRQPQLAQLKIILISSVYRKTAYKRTPFSLYGADDYIEQHHLPDDLVPKIHRLLSGLQAIAEAERAIPAAEEQLSTTAVTVGTEAQEFMHSANARIQNAEEQFVARPDEEALTKARRLARIIVSDIVLYHEARVNEGVRSGNFMTLFAEEIREGHNLLSSRVAPAICAQEDFLKDAFTAFVQRRQQELKMDAVG
jgi:predicted Zn finger-like uncharacterized protein